MVKVGDTFYRIKYADVLPCDDTYYLYTIAVGVIENIQEGFETSFKCYLGRQIPSTAIYINDSYCLGGL